MAEDNMELKNSIEKLYTMIKEYPDEPKSSYDFVVFLKKFLKLKTKQTLPTIEVMTLIKHHKPIIFSSLRKMSKNNMLLQILTELSMDINTANKNLEKIMK